LSSGVNVDGKMRRSNGMLTFRTSAKLNLFLDIVQKRTDGYHDIVTILQPVAIWDELKIERIEHGIELRGDDASISWGEDNLCHRAAALILQEAGVDAGVRIDVSKGIPAGGGFGGASSDAAAVLIAVNEIFSLGYSRERLAEMALMIGSDVPFFIYGRPAIGTGRGEILEDWSGLRGVWVVVVKPEVSISTTWAYNNINLPLTREIDTDKLNSVLEGLKNLPEKPLESWNVFTEPIVRNYPVIGNILQGLSEEKPLIYSLTGSGAGCFALFSEENRAKEVAIRFKKRGFFVKVTQPISQTTRLIQ